MASGLEEQCPLVTVVSILATALASSPRRRERGVRRQSACLGKGFRHPFPCPPSRGRWKRRTKDGWGEGGEPVQR